MTDSTYLGIRTFPGDIKELKRRGYDIADLDKHDGDHARNHCNPLHEAMTEAVLAGHLEAMDVVQIQSNGRAWLLNNYERVSDALVKMPVPMAEPLVNMLVDKGWMTKEQGGIALLRGIDL